MAVTLDGMADSAIPDTSKAAGMAPAEGWVSETTKSARDQRVTAAIADGRLSTQQEAAWRAALDRDEELVTTLLATMPTGAHKSPHPTVAAAAASDSPFRDLVRAGRLTAAQAAAWQATLDARPGLAADLTADRPTPDQQATADAADWAAWERSVFPGLQD